jgi:hypothetical protein
MWIYWLQCRKPCSLTCSSVKFLWRNLLESLSAEVDITLYEKDKHECEVHGIDSGLISNIKTKTDSITKVQSLNILSFYLLTVWQNRLERDAVVTACTSFRGQSLLGCYATLTGKSLMFLRIIVPSSVGPGTFLGLLDLEDEVTVILTTNQFTIDPSTWS